MLCSEIKSGFRHCIIVLVLYCHLFLSPGEEDVTGYDLSRLQKPIIDNYSPITKTEKVNEAFQGDSIPEVNKPRIGDIINERLLKPDTADDDDALDIDSLRQYDNEGTRISIYRLYCH